jgi:hypothetical protein
MLRVSPQSVEHIPLDRLRDREASVDEPNHGLIDQLADLQYLQCWLQYNVRHRHHLRSDDNRIAGPIAVEHRKIDGKRKTCALAQVFLRYR